MDYFFAFKALFKAVVRSGGGFILCLDMGCGLPRRLFFLSFVDCNEDALLGGLVGGGGLSVDDDDDDDELSSLSEFTILLLPVLLVTLLFLCSPPLLVSSVLTTQNML